MPEQLAIRTANGGSWRRGDREGAAKSIVPRDIDGGKKSSWAHFAIGSNEPTEENLSDPLQATLKIQALALLIFASRSGVQSRVEGISLSRDHLPFPLTEDEQPHLLESCRTTHRSLMPGGRDECVEAAGKIMNSDGFVTWKFSRDELRLLLFNLLKMHAVAPEMRREAEVVLKAWGPLEATSPADSAPSTDSGPDNLPHRKGAS